MKRMSLFTFWSICLVAIPGFAAKPRMTEPVQIQVVLPDGHTPAAHVSINFSVKRNLFSSYRTLASATTDSKGTAFFPAKKDKKFNWMALSFAWTPPDTPERTLLLEYKLDKGGKADGAQIMLPDKPYASFVLEGFYNSNCLNLFQVTPEKGKPLQVVLTLPESYSECDDPGKDFTNIKDIGNRDINKGNINYFKFDKDRQMGAQFYQNMKSTPENRPLNDPLVVNYVENMVQRIVKASDMPNLQFTVTVLDANVMNAFAVPGGYIFVYRGLIEQTESEGELAGVLAHEIAHVTSRHGTEGVTSAINKMLLATTISEIAAHNMKEKDQWLVDLAQVAIFSGTQFWIMGGTRKREAEADYLGVEYAYRAGYDPDGIASLFERWSNQKDHKQTRLDQFFSDHPNDLNRVKDVRQTTAFFMPPSQKRYGNSANYERVKQRLKQLPPPAATGEVAANSLFSSFKQTNEDIIMETMQEYFNKDQKAD